MKKLYLLSCIMLCTKAVNAIPKNLPGTEKPNYIPFVPSGPPPAPIQGKVVPVGQNRTESKPTASTIQTTEMRLPSRPGGVADDQVLSQKQVAQSDAICAQLLQVIAQEVFTDIPAKLQSKSNQKVPQFKTAYDAYIFYIKDMLLTLNSNPDFKKNGALNSLITEVNSSLSFESFFSKDLPLERIHEESFIQGFYDQLITGKSPLLLQFIGVISPLFFRSPLEPAVIDSLEDILINVVVSGRKKYDLTSASRAISDGLVVSVLDHVFNLVAQELSKRSADSAASAKLSQEYTKVLRRDLSRLRVEPQFLKYENVLGTAARARAQAAGNPIQKLALYPILDLLETTDISLLDRNKLKYALNGQLVFSDQALHDIFNQTALFDALLKDRVSRIMEQRGSVSVEQILNEMIPLAKSAPQLKDAVTLLSKSVGMKPEIRELQAELNKIDIDTEKVVALFKKLAGTSKIPFEEHLRSVIDASIKEKETALKSVEILKAARADYERTKKYVDSFVLQELKKKQREAAHPAKFDKPIALFTALDRTPDAVQRIFSYNLGVGSATDTYAKKPDFRKWFHPYGLLLEVLRTAPLTAQEIASEGPHAQLLVLLDSLKALNTGSITNKKYAQALLAHRELVVAGIYKNMLDRMIIFAESLRINELIEEITQFVKNVGIQLEEQSAFRERMTTLRSFLVGLSLKSTIETLAHLNDGTGDRPVEGLATDAGGGVGLRNAIVYQNLKGLFKPLLDQLTAARDSKNMQSLTYADFSKARDLVTASLAGVLEKPAVQARFVKTKPAEEQRKEIIAAFERYFNRLWMRDSSGLQNGALQSIQSAAALLPVSVQKEPEAVQHEEEYDGSIPPAPPAPPM